MMDKTTGKMVFHSKRYGYIEVLKKIWLHPGFDSDIEGDEEENADEDDTNVDEDDLYTS